ncbi:MAG: PhzF family phenazine biosynthesis protein [Leptospiraceae bacterium]|nr:PhzF family phenazine biosynthesis protein [Leptospiraceae bacterium]
MRLPVYQVDAFTDQLFAGNPAALVPLEEWLPDTMLQAIARENNLSETAFWVQRADQDYDLRWFTPVAEVDLCGHATLASAWLKAHHLDEARREWCYHTRSGPLRVARRDRQIQMKFPLLNGQGCAVPPALEQALGVEIKQCQAAMDYIVFLESAADLRNLEPDMQLLLRLDRRGVIVSAPADDGQADFVLRFFAPRFGINEDPVTGSAFTQVAAWWSARLGKQKLIVQQISSRSGQAELELTGSDSLLISGQAALYLEGFIFI